ncbi:MAG: hypothetical protein V3W44_10795 [Dehalococcoidales bacterium]
MGLIEAIPTPRIRPVLAIPFWTGTFRDVSPNALTITNVGTTQWQQSGDRDHILCTGTGRFSVAHDDAIDLTNGTLYIHGLITRQFINQTFFRKLGVGVRYHFYSSNGTNLVLYDGTNASALVVPIVGETSLAACWTGGELPQFYLSGAAAGAGALVVNTAGTNQALTVFGEGANACEIPSSFVVAWDAPLTTAEIADVHTWGEERFTPRKQWPGGGLDIPTRLGTNFYPAFMDNIQTARVTTANETTGKLSNTNFVINTGTWAITEDALGRYVSCVVGGQLQYNLLGADTTTTSMFTGTGTAALTKNPTNFQVDMLAGETFWALQLLE